MLSLVVGRMKKHLWSSHYSFGDTIEFIIRDFSGAKVESWKVSGEDEKRKKQILKTIKVKHGINLFFASKDEDRDLSWLE